MTTNHKHDQTIQRPRRPRRAPVLELFEGVAGEALPLHRRLYRSLREAILGARLAPGSRLPSSRALAADLGVSRQTTEEALAQLHAEGFLVRRVGDGTYVAPSLPVETLVRPRGRPAAFRAGDPRPTAPGGRGGGKATLERPLSRRGAWLATAAGCREPREVRPFAAGLPALEAFPLATWQRLFARRARRSGRELLGYGPPEGYAPLRRAIAAYLGTSRGVRCDAGQVIVLSSSQQALDLAARLLADPGDTVWIEDPGYPGARAAFTAAGLELVPVPVGPSGIDVAAGRRLAPRARLAYVTPSHQYPLGVTLSAGGRLAILEWARESGAWIVEDDYDSEFRYDGRPLAALQGLDGDQGGPDRVLYAGTFTKVLFPSLRLAYLVVPRALAAAFANARSLLDGHTPTLPQAVLADFIEEGHFASHLRRMRQLYRARRDTVVEALRSRCPELTLQPNPAGLHLTARVRSLAVETALVRIAPRYGLELRGLSAFYDPAAVAHREPGLVLAYGGLTLRQIERGVESLRLAMAARASLMGAESPDRRGST